MLLLLGELEARRTGSSAASALYHRHALPPLRRLRPVSPFERMRVRCRHVFASVSLGDRDATRRGIDAIDALLGTQDGRGVLAQALEDPTVADRLAAELYAPFWAATQVDRHDRAHEFAALMRTYANPASPTAVAERYTVMTQEVFVGTHTIASFAETAADVTSDTDPILMLESGRDEDAAGFAAAMTPRLNMSPSRSALEAFVLLIRALVAPAGLKLRDVQLPLDRSSGFWGDGAASSFIRFSATFALLAIDEREQARSLSRAHPVDDWFDVTASALIALDQDDPSSAMELLDRATPQSWGPRADAITMVLTATAHGRLGHVDAAAETVRSVWTQAPPLARFATRFVTVEDFAALTALSDKLPPDVVGGLAAARDDARPLRRTMRPKLTRAERELLASLRAGRTYSEIATIRVVSINTVRTQLRSLRHKLGASDRVDAVRRAEVLRLFDD